MTFPQYCAIDCTIAVERPAGHWNYQEIVGKTSGLGTDLAPQPHRPGYLEVELGPRRYVTDQ